MASKLQSRNPELPIIFLPIHRFKKELPTGKPWATYILKFRIPWVLQERQDNYMMPRPQQGLGLFFIASWVWEVWDLKR